jgi:hypothetical protein
MFEVGVGIYLCHANFWFLPADGCTIPVNLVALRQISYPQLEMRSNGLKTGNLTSLSRPTACTGVGKIGRGTSRENKDWISVMGGRKK